MLLALVGRHYLMNHWSEDFFDATIAFRDPKNDKIDIPHALLFRTMIIMLISSLPVAAILVFWLQEILP